ncbi:hypothetical protein ACFWY6_13640 [Streptomyces sp. NPDC059037]|uniref:hypothetical protein n=1 Tax=Streptomyces sp. NPDC059037 TaxID=3346710 RepID=UPI00368D1F84
MTTNVNLSEAISAAEDALLTHERPWPDIECTLAGYVERLSHPEAPYAPRSTAAVKHIHLAQLLLALGMRELSLAVANVTLRHMELTEADREEFTADTWNELGSLLAEHDDLDRARLVLNCALSRAQRTAAPELARILANLSAVSLRAGHLGDAKVWAQKAVAVLGMYWGGDPEARLTADWVRVEVASIQRDTAELARTLGAFADSVDRFTSSKDEDHPKAIAARSALAAARFQAARAVQDEARSEAELGELEIAHLRASALLGIDHQQTLIAQAALAAAEFDAADGAELSVLRRKQAVALLEAASSRASETLGRDHAQARALRTALADLRVAATPPGELDYRIEHTYTPQENEARNQAKSRALRRENNVIRLVAHAGASFLLPDLRRFHDHVIHALRRGSYFYAIIVSPWNSLAIFTKHDATAERPNSHNIVDIVAASDYYNKTFLPVVDAYRTLRKTYRDRVELRFAHIDIPGSTLLTTDMGFFEPYITSNPEHRTRRKLNVIEMEFHKDSRYYEDSKAEFKIQWELASTLDQFEASEEEHKTALRNAVRALSDDQLRKPGAPLTVREDGERHP